MISSLEIISRFALSSLLPNGRIGRESAWKLDDRMLWYAWKVLKMIKQFLDDQLTKTAGISQVAGDDLG